MLGIYHCSCHAKNFNFAIAMYVFFIELIVNLERLENIDIVKFGFSSVIFLMIILVSTILNFLKMFSTIA